MASLQPEGRQVDFRLLAQLHECETEVGVPMQVGLTDLVKDRDAAKIVAPLEKAAHEIVELIVGPDRIAERDPRAALHAVHDKRGAILVEQQCLVPEIDEDRERRGLRGDRTTRVLEVGVGRRLGFVRGVADQTGKSEEQQDHHGTNRGSKESRCVTL